jgi:hypothetical protein
MRRSVTAESVPGRAPCNASCVSMICHEHNVSRNSRNLSSFFPVDFFFPVYIVMLSLGPSFCYRRTMPAILVPPPIPRLLAHVSRLTLMSSLRPMSYIPHLVHVPLHPFKILPIVRSCVPLRDVLKEVYYIVPPRLSLSLFFFFVIWAVSY